MILVTGGTGTCGRAIVQTLLARAARVRVMVRDPAKAAGQLADEVEIARGDFDDVSAMAAAMEDVERAFLLAPSTEHQPEFEANFLDAAQRASVGHVVKLSVLKADPNSSMRFQRLHGKIEEKLKSSRISWTMLQPTFFMQNFLRSAQTIKSQSAIYHPAGNGRSGYVDVADIAAVAAATLTEGGHEGKSYVITGPEDLSVADVAAKLSAVLGKTVNYVDVPVEAARQAMLAEGIPPWNVDGVLELMEGLRSGVLAGLSDNVQQVGKKVPTTMEQFLQANKQALGG